jgi:hypothetical protein
MRSYDSRGFRIALKRLFGVFDINYLAIRNLRSKIVKLYLEFITISTFNEVVGSLR